MLSREDDDSGVYQRRSGTTGSPPLPEGDLSLLLGGLDVLLETSEVQKDSAGSHAARNHHIPRLFPLPGEDEPEQTLHHLRKADADLSGRGPEK